MRIVLHGLIVLVMYAVVAPFMAPALAVTDAPVLPTTWFLVVASALANLVVITYHYTVPPHPKFLMVPWRRWILRSHILSGTVELTAGLVALLSADREGASRVMALAALCFHVPSAFAQTPIVFGARAIMRPAYLLCIGLHAFSAVQLWLHPTSTHWVASTFLIFNIYVWCRIYYFLFDKLGLFQGARYSVTIIVAGLTTAPVVLGTAAVMVIVIGCGVYMALVWLLFIRGTGGWRDFVREAARDSAVPDEIRGLWSAGSAARDAQDAANCFRALDDDGDGLIAPRALERLLDSAGLSRSAVTRFIESRAGALLSLEEFTRTVWSIREVRDAVFASQALADARSARDKAELVFKRLDIDGDGYLGRAELELLLRGWAMPTREVDRWLARSGASATGRMDFATFFRSLAPVWKFIYYDVVEARFGAQEDMITRAVTARRDEAAASRVRHGVKHELAVKVPFLAGVTGEALDEIAGSFTEEHIAAGAVLFSEGTPGDAFFVIHRGRLRLSRDDEAVADLGPGDYLGEGALLADSPRSATARALEETDLLRMTRASFDYVVGRHATLRAVVEQIHERRRLDELQRAVHRDLLGKVPFLRSANAELIALLVQSLLDDGRLRIAAGTPVFMEGEPGDALYVVGRGTVAISRAGAPVAEIGPGGFFGEGALLSGEPRVASAVAASDVVLYRLPRATLEVLLERFPAQADALKREHAARQREHRVALLQRHPRARRAPAGTIEVLERALTRVPLAHGSVLFKEGEASDRLYVVARGRVRVEKGGVHVATMEDGAWFDERTVIEQRPRAATIVADGDVELFALDRAALLSALPSEARADVTTP